MTRRAEILDAALLVVAEGGLKGLTHRAVDARAGLPAGSTANLFRTRESLVSALLEELEARDRNAFEASATTTGARTVPDLAELLARGAAAQLSPANQALTRVRLAMMQAYPDEVGATHRRLLASLESQLSACGVGDAAGRAGTLAAFLDGLLLHALTVSPGPVDPASVSRDIVSLLEERSP